MQQRITKITILPCDAPIFSVRATSVEIDDLAGGEFLVVTQNGRDNKDGIAIDLEEWESIKNGINFMFEQIKKADLKQTEKEESDQAE